MRSSWRRFLRGVVPGSFEYGGMGRDAPGVTSIAEVKRGQTAPVKKEQNLSNINISMDPDLALEVAKSRLARVAKRVEEEFVLKVKISGGTATVQGTGVTGKTEVTPDSISANVTLSRLLDLYRDKVRKGIEEGVKEEFK